MKKRLLILIVFGFGFFLLRAQAPIIYAVDHYVGHTGHTITLTGAGFGTVAGNLDVYFGAMQGTVKSVTDQILEVSVPPGATFENISVTNTVTGLTAYSHDQFQLSFGGSHPFSASNLSSQLDLSASTGLYDVELCDLDGDSKTDIISVNDNATSISLFQNTSVVGTLSFVKSTLSIGARTLHVRSGDFNGDGKKDIVISEGGNGQRVFILKNTSAPGAFSFSLQTLTFTGKKPKRVDIKDMDLDGKPDLIITDQGGADFIVVPNTSTLASITFGSPQYISITNAASSDGLAIEDLNGDQLPDIVVNQFLTANSNLYVFENKSVPGNISFGSQITLTVPGTIVNLRVGDIDGDGKPDLAATQLLNAGISVFLNKGGSGKTKFSDQTSIATDDRPWGIDFADIDGDGKNDAVVASITNKSVTVLNNESTTGNASYTKTIIPTTYINRHIRAGDLDGDGKPEIIFTSIDDNNNGIPASKVSIFRNKSCFIPELAPAGPLTVCSGYAPSMSLTSSQSPGATYTWQIDGSTTATGTSASQSLSTSGSYTVIAVAEAGSCNQVSNAVNVTVVAGGSVSAPTMGSNSPICINDNLQLTASSTGADGYDWTGPAGYTASGSPATRNGFLLSYAGRYNVDVKVGSCIAQQGSVVVETVAMPSFLVGYSGSTIICSGNTITLTANPSSSAFTYQWFEKTTGSISGATSTSLAVSQSGEYYFTAQSIAYPSCTGVKSDTTKVLVVTTPVASFTVPNTTCVNSPVQVSNQSTVDSQTTPTYSWDFGDTQTSTDANPSHTYSAAQAYTITLTVSYAGNCSAQTTQSITAATAPTATITSPNTSFKFCAGDSLKLSLNNSFNTYTWSTSETTPTIVVKKPGTYTVDVTTAAGCKIKATQAVDTLASPIITLLAKPDHITAGETSQLSASGINSYVWHPGKYLSDSTSAMPVAMPPETVSFHISGKGDNGCIGNGILTVNVKADAIANLIKPANFFSPNGDAVNPQWTVDNINSFPQCAVSIYDDKGVKVFEAKPYLNSWDGTYHGRPLPDGVYYFIIRCDGEESHPKTGSITLLR